MLERNPILPIPPETDDQKMRKWMKDLTEILNNYFSRSYDEIKSGDGFTFPSTLTVEGNGNIKGSLDVDGNAAVDGNLDVGISIASDGDLLIGGDAEITGDLSVDWGGSAIPLSGWLSNGTPYYTKRIPIGPWDMTVLGGVAVNHGVGSNWVSIVVLGVSIYDDDYSRLDSIYNFSGAPGAYLLAGGVTAVTPTNIALDNRDGGHFDSASYNSTGVNRGYIWISYLME
jgi:hypothetical protein